MRARYVLALIVAVAVLGDLNQAGATTVKDATANTVVFSDNFENQTVDSALSTANITPGPGSYSTAPTGALTRNAASPGAHQGTNYVEIDRQNPPKSGSTTRLTAAFTPIPPGNTMETTFAYNLVSGYFQIQLYDSAGVAAWGLYASPGEVDGRWRFLDVLTGDGHFSGDTTSLTFGALNTWHELTFAYTVGAPAVTLTVDGVSETVDNVTTNAIANIDRLRFTGDGSSTTHFYVDAVPSLNTYDYNQNGFVDAADYVLWRKSPGDHLGDPVGYDNWRSNFGLTSGSGAGLPSAVSSSAVPEPTASVLIIMALVSIGVPRTIHRRK